MPRPTLVPVEFPIDRGLVTKWGGEKNEGLLVCENADSYERIGTVAKVPGSTRKSNLGPGAIHSLHYYEHFQLNGILAREVLCLSGDQFMRVNADKSLTHLKSGFVGEALADVTLLDRIHLASPNNNPVKFDGARVERWGLYPPGTEETVFETFSSAASWTGANGATLSTSTVQRGGYGSVKFDKTGTAATNPSMERTGLALNFVNIFLVQLLLLIPEGAIPKLAQTNALTIRLKTNATDYNEWRFDIGDMVEGWNFFGCVLQLPDAVGGAGANYASITRIEFILNFAAAIETQSGFHFAKFYYLDSGAPVAFAGAAGSITGSVSYVVTYISKYGLESNAGISSGSITLTNQRASLSGIPVSPDPQVVGRRLYRDLNGDQTWRLVTELADNSTTTFEDDVDNSARGIQTPPFFGDELLDHSPPPRMSAVATWNDHVIGINAEVPFEIVISLRNKPDAFPLRFRRQFKQQLVGLRRVGIALLILHTDGYYVMSGDLAENFRYDEPSEDVGISGRRAIAGAKTFGIGWHDDGPYVFDFREPWYLGSAIKDQIEALPPEEFEDIHVALDRGRLRCVFFAKSAIAGPYDRCFIYEFGRRTTGAVSPEGSGVDALDLRIGDWRTLALPSAINPLCSCVIETAADRPELWVGAADRYIYRLQDPATRDWATGVSTAPIACTIEPDRKPIGKPGHYSIPRYLELSGICTEASNWTLTVQTFDGIEGPLLDSKTQVVALPTGAFSKLVPIGRMRAGAWASWVLSNANADEDGLFETPIRMHVLVGRFRGARGA